MAKLPQIKSTGSITTQRVMPTGAGKVAGAIAGAATDIATVANEWKVAEDSTNDLSQWNEYNREIGEILLKADAESDYNKVESYREQLSSVKQKYQSNLSESKNGIATFQQMENDNINRDIKLRGGFRQKMLDKQGIDHGLDLINKKKQYIAEPNPALRQEILASMVASTENTYANGIISDARASRELEEISKIDYDRAQNDAYANPKAFLENSDSYKLDAEQKAGLISDAEKASKKQDIEFEINTLIGYDRTTNETETLLSNPASSPDDIAESTQQSVMVGNMTQETADNFTAASISPKAVNAVDNSRIISQTAMLADNLIKGTFTDKEKLEEIAKQKNKLLKARRDGKITRETLSRTFNTLSSDALDKASAARIDVLQKKGEFFAYGYQDAHEVFKQATGSEAAADGLLNQYYVKTFTDYKDLSENDRKIATQDIINTYQGNVKAKIANQPNLSGMSDDEIISARSITEEDIKETMKKNKMTRKQVFDRLRKGR